MSKKNHLERMEIRLTSDEKNEIDSRANAAGVNRSELVRLLATHGYIIVPKELPEILRLLRYLGNNVNQLARSANRNQMPYTEDIKEIKKSVDEIKNLVSVLVEKITYLNQRNTKSSKDENSR